MSVEAPPTTADLMLAAVRAAPFDGTTLRAARDALTEAGFGPWASSTRIVAAARAGRADRVRALVNSKTALAGRVRRAVRRGHPVVPVDVRPGHDGPRLEGTDGHYVFRGSSAPVRYPNAARAAGHKLDYVRSTRVLAVGADWVLRVCKKELETWLKTQ